MQSIIKYDSIVIGSGPGGAITAWEMKKNNKDVLLIEAGNNYRLDSCKAFSTTEMEQKYKYGGLTPTFNAPKITYIEGSCVGGGSEINSGFYHRIPPDIIDEWKEKFQIVQFDQNSLEPHFTTIENEISVSCLPNIDDAAKASLKLKEGADKLGWYSLEVPRWYRFTDGNNGIKQSITETYVKWYMDAGGELKSELKATKLKYNKNKWQVSCVDTNKSRHTLIEAKNVFLCCGAISTPFLLRSSGIKRNIGNTLQMHPTVKVVAEFDEVINFTDMGVPVHQVKEFSPSISFGCSISSKPYLALAMLDNDKYISRVNESWEKMAVYYAMIKPIGIGTIRKLPLFKDPFVRYYLTKSDMSFLSEGLRKLSTMLLKADARHIYPSIRNYGKINCSKDIDKIPKHLPKDSTSIMTIHLFSSCPMGENQDICAADSFGKVFGYDGLYINDGSLIPSAPGVNPQGTIMTIARRNIFHFLGLD